MSGTRKKSGSSRATGAKKSSPQKKMQVSGVHGIEKWNPKGGGKKSSGSRKSGGRKKT